MIRVLVIAALTVGARSDGHAHRPHQDGYDAPTDTHVALVAGLWHDDALKPGEGWHLYHFDATETGLVAFQMRAPRDHATLWSYLRILDGDHSWAGVGNRVTNLCEVIVPVERGKHYDVIATSQRNASLARGKPQTSDGPYTIGAISIPLR